MLFQNVYLVMLGTVIDHTCCTALLASGGRYVSTKISFSVMPSTSPGVDACNVPGFFAVFPFQMLPVAVLRISLVVIPGLCLRD
jgi:hypothetical protein